MTIEFIKVDEAHIKVFSTPDIEQGIKDFFTYKAPGYQFHPKYKARLWNGDVSLYDLKTKTLAIGLFKRLSEFASESDIELKFVPNERYSTFDQIDDVSKEDFNAFIADLNIWSKSGPITVRDYQFDASYKAVREKKITLISPTSSGKSVVLYIAIRWILEQDPDSRVILIVPNIQLVNQMFNDFKEYSLQNGFNVDQVCQKLYGGQSKDLVKRLLITTWQSFTKLSKTRDALDFMRLYRGVIVDECHQSSSKEIQSILSKCTNAQYRIGASGTIDQSAGAKVNLLQIEGYLGPVHRVITTKELMDAGQVSALKIKSLVLKHSIQNCELLKKADYQEEMKWLIDNEDRNAFICKLALAAQGATLLLVRNRDTHAKVLYERLLKVSTRPVYYISGDVSGDQREIIRNLANVEDCIIVATLATMAVGVNIPNLRNIIFGSPSKSMVTVLQSIGRALRLHNDKSCANVYDIIDDLRYKKHDNYAYTHGVERLTIYRKEKFDIAIKEIALK